MKNDEFAARLAAVLAIPESVNAFVEVAKLYAESEGGQREQIRTGWDYGRTWSVPGLVNIDEDHVQFNHVTITDELGLAARQRIAADLVFQSIQNAEFDGRGNLGVQCLLYHAALEAGFDPDPLFEWAAQLSVDPIDRMLRGFVAREPVDKCLWAFGYRMHRVENRIDFEWYGNDDDYDDQEPKALDRWGRPR